MKNRALILIVLLAGLFAAETPSPRDVDPVTRRRAEAVLADLLKTEETLTPAPVEAAIREQMSVAENLLREIDLFLERGAEAQAGERFLKAAECLKNIPSEQRPGLGARFHAATDRIQGLARRFADAAVDGETTPAAGGAAAGP